jgi:hypothetical protein
MIPYAELEEFLCFLVARAQSHGILCATTSGMACVRFGVAVTTTGSSIARWMRGGWTSHLTWKTKPEETCLDVFGIAPRGSSLWEVQLAGIYARYHVVAEMKRTNREKEWPFATSPGGAMLVEGGFPRLAAPLRCRVDEQVAAKASHS